MNNRKGERFFWGIFLVVAAVVLIISQLGYLGNVGVVSIFLAVILIACLIKSLLYRNISGVLFPLAFLYILFAQPLGMPVITPWVVLGATVLCSMGLSLLFHKKKDYSKYYHHDNDRDYETVETCTNQYERLSTTFGSSIKYIKTEDFQKADIHCNFGAMKLYFDNAVIQQGMAEINFDVSFGGVELYLPKEWKIENHIDVTCAAVDEKNHNNSTGTPNVKLCGRISFAGITIIYV